MTYEEAKDRVAMAHANCSFQTLKVRWNDAGVQAVMQEAAELYAKSKWDEALELAAKTGGDTSAILLFKDKFKP